MYRKVYVIKITKTADTKIEHTKYTKYFHRKWEKGKREREKKKKSRTELHTLIHSYIELNNTMFGNTTKVRATIREKFCL